MTSLSNQRVANEFREYRGQPKWSDQEWEAHWRARDYQQPAPYQPAEPGLNPWPAPPPPKAAVALTQEQKDFLASTIPDLEDAGNTAFAGGPGYWTGKKLLGKGGFGMVALWQYEGPAGDQSQKYHQVAVKEATGDAARHLDNDNRIHWELTKTKSQHVNHCLIQGRTVDPQAENLHPDWEDKVKRLILEYCPLGDVRQLIERFQKLGRPFKETTLWKIFECLVDGISVMETGKELSYPSPTYEYLRRGRQNWDPIIHFDMKPGNIFMSDDRFSHLTTPVCKIGDFGLAEFDWNFFLNGDAQYNDKVWLQIIMFRDNGTPGYFVPEQFTEEWEFRDYKNSNIAGKYSHATNVWGIGCIMYQLVLLTHNAPDPKVPFTPSWNLNGNIPKGRTFGLPLHGQSRHYSRQLTDLVQECLYEVPQHRPGLEDLKTRVRSGFLDALHVDPIPDLWKDFEPQPPGRADGRPYCRGVVKKTGKSCENAGLDEHGGYCGLHKKQRSQQAQQTPQPQVRRNPVRKFRNAR